jgi:two-component system CheB/CheR fusion protein
LRADEVFLLHFMSLDIGLPLEPLRQPLLAIVTGQSQFHEVLLNARNRRGRAVQCEVICTPLIGTDSEVQGVILLMEEHEQLDEIADS